MQNMDSLYGYYPACMSYKFYRPEVISKGLTKWGFRSHETTGYPHQYQAYEVGTY